MKSIDEIYSETAILDKMCIEAKAARDASIAADEAFLKALQVKEMAYRDFVVKEMARIYYADKIKKAKCNNAIL